MTNLFLFLFTISLTSCINISDSDYLNINLETGNISCLDSNYHIEYVDFLKDDDTMAIPLYRNSYGEKYQKINIFNKLSDLSISPDSLIFNNSKFSLYIGVSIDNITMPYRYSFSVKELMEGKDTLIIYSNL